MDVSEGSCSSRNLVADGPSLSYCGRSGRESGHESHASASGGSNSPVATMFETHTNFPSNATAAIKVKSTLPRNVSTSAIRSSWIQRLKPFAQSGTPKEETANFSTKENPICTHFTKDFSSCSRRLNKTSHHTRSSSWPPHTMQLEGVEHFHLALEEPADAAEGSGKAVVISSNIDHQIIRVPSTNITHSSDAGSRTGNLFTLQQSRREQISAEEGFVPSALNGGIPTLKKSNDLEESECGGDSKPKDYLAQGIGESNIALQMEALVQREEAAKNWDHSHGFCGTFKGDIHTPLHSVSAYTAAHRTGASADADDGVIFGKPLDCCMGNKILPLQTSSRKPDCEIAVPTAVVSENRLNIEKADGTWCPGRGITETGIASKDARNLGCVHTVKNFKQFKESLAETHLLNNFSDARASSKLHHSSGNSYLTEAFGNAHERDAMTACAVESRTLAASGCSKQDVVSKRVDGFCPKGNNLADFQVPHFSAGGRVSRSTVPVGPLHEDATRSRIRETSLGEYWNSWVRLIQGPVNVNPSQTGSPMAKSQQYHKNLFQPSSSNGRLDAKQKFEDYSCNPHKHVSDDSRNFGGCDLPPRILTSSSKDHCKFLGRRMSSRGQEHYSSADRSSHFSLKGATGRVDSQPRNKDSILHRRFLDDGSSHSRMHSTHPSQGFCNNESAGEGSSMHQVWIQRWHSSAKLSAMSGMSAPHVPDFSRSLSSDQLLKSVSASAHGPPIFSHKAMGFFDHNLTDSGRGSNRYTDASGVHLDSGSASTTPGSLLAGRNFAAFRSGYMGSCVEATAKVGKSAGKLPSTSLQNRGFCGLPCTNPKFVKCKILPEDETLHSVDPDDIESVEHDINNS